MAYSLNDLFPGMEIKPILHSTTAVAKMMHNPKRRGNIRFRSFLREQGIFEGDYPAKEYLEREYFVITTRRIRYDKDCVPVIKVTEKGIQFILNNEKEILNENK